MKGKIRSDSRERCPICGERLLHDTGKAITCPYHPFVVARKLIYKFAGRQKRTTSYDIAVEQLARWMIAKADNPGMFRSVKHFKFKNHLEKFLSRLEKKTNATDPKERMTIAHYKDYVRILSKASVEFGESDVRSFSVDVIKAYIDGRPEYKVGRTKNNVGSMFNQFFAFMADKSVKVITPEQVPASVFYDPGPPRKKGVLSKEEQALILDKIYEQNPNEPKVYLAFHLLCTYPCLRPNNIRLIAEEDFHFSTQPGKSFLRFWNGKKRAHEEGPLLDVHVSWIRNLLSEEKVRGIKTSGIRFFRHPSNQPYGRCFLPDVWKRAYDAVLQDQVSAGVEAAYRIRWASLYPGTKHSSISSAKDRFSPEEIKHASMHEQTASFEAYFRWDAKDQLKVYDAMCPEIRIPLVSPKCPQF